MKATMHGDGGLLLAPTKPVVGGQAGGLAVALPDSLGGCAKCELGGYNDSWSPRTG